MRKGYVYILASMRNGTLYTGVTIDLPGRLYEHQNRITPGFTSRYGIKTLVWFEEHELIADAIRREKTIKKWPRAWKLNLIEVMNPDWTTSPTTCTVCKGGRLSLILWRRLTLASIATHLIRLL